MILAEFSHILTFSMLFIAAVFDVRSELGDVPDIFPAAAVIGGLILHGAQSLLIGSFEPILYSLAVGAVFSVYGWAAYWKGMWGGADAFALTALGVGAPYTTLSALGAFTQAINLFFNLVIVASIYAIGFSVVKAYRTENFREKLFNRFSRKKKRISAELFLGLTVFLIFDLPFSAAFYLSVACLIFLLRFLKVVEEHAMFEEVKPDNLEGGEVVKQEKSDRIKGVTREEIKDLEGPVKVMHGIRFIPVFPVALLLTDAGLSFFYYLIYL